MFVRSVPKVIKRGTRSLNTDAVKSYIQDKSTWIPFAHVALKEHEYNSYQMFRNIKTGNLENAKEMVDTNNYTVSQLNTFSDYAKELKKQPYSLINIVIGYGLMRLGWDISVINGLLGKKALALDKSEFLSLIESIDMSDTILKDASMMPPWMATSLTVVTASASIYAGGKIFYDELRSPYYRYDGIIGMFDFKIKELKLGSERIKINQNKSKDEITNDER